MKRFFKSVRRFWRGLTRRMRVVIILAVILAVCLSAFGIYKLTEEKTQKEPNINELMFEKIEREGIASILLHHDNGEEYRVVQYQNTVNDAYGNPVTTTAFKMMHGESDYGYLTLNAEKLTALIVGTGSHYVYDTVATAPEAGVEDYEAQMARYREKLLEFDLGDDAPYYELTSTSGTVYRVYYGQKSATGGSYYVRLAGRDAVYITTGTDIGELLYADSPVSLLDSTLFDPTGNQYSYAYPNHFSITDFTRYKREDFGGKTVEAGQRVGFTVVDDAGEKQSASCDLTLEQHKDFKVLIGQSLGVYPEGAPFVFDAWTPKPTKEDPNAGEVLTYCVLSIDYIEVEKDVLAATFVNPSERDLAHQYSIYEFTLPSLTHYLPSTDEMMTALDNTMNLTGSVVEIGLSPALIDKYGLYRYTIEISYPYFDSSNMYEVDENGDVTEDLKPTGYLPGFIYVSDVQEDGTRYVGSMMYNLIVKVDASALSYLDYSLNDWVEPYMVNAAIMEVDRVYLSWNFDDSIDWLKNYANISVKFGTEKDATGNTYETIDSALAIYGDAQKHIHIDKKIYTQFFYRLYYIKYKGEHDLSDSEVEALLSDEEKVALTLYIDLSDGTRRTYRFVPISHDRVLVAVVDKYGRMNAELVIYGTAFRDLARSYINMMEGVPFDHEDRY